MASLTDYVNLDALQQLQDSFCTAAGADLRICDQRGEPPGAARKTTATQRESSLAFRNVAVTSIS